MTTYSEDNLPNAAPMGIVMIDDQTVIISPFLQTQTFKNIEKSKNAVVNFTHDLEIFFESAFSDRRPKLPLNFFVKAPNIDAPALKAASACFEVRAREIQVHSDRSRIIGKIVNWYFEPHSFHPINRGFNLVLESIIHATRIMAFKKDMLKIKPLMDLIKQYRIIIEKVSPAGKYINLMDKIQNIIENK